MGEGVTVTVDYLFKPGLADEFCKVLPRVLPDTARSAGFRDFRAVRHGSEPDRVLLLQTWDDETSYREYIEWRTQRGDVGLVEQMVVHARTDVWPNLVVSA